MTNFKIYHNIFFYNQYHSYIQILNYCSTEYLEGEYDFGGVKGVHEKPEKEKGEIHIKGPIVQPLVLWVN